MMEVLSSSSSSSLPINFRSRCLFSHPSSPSRFPSHFHPNDNNSVSSSTSSCFGLSISRSNSFVHVKRFNSRRRSNRPLRISAVFDRFTERAIKAVILSQREAKSLGNDMVFTQHLLLGLIGEDRDPDGFLGSGLNIDEAREAVRSIWQTSNHDSDSGKQEGSIVSSTEVPFSASTKRVFEAAVEYSRSMGYNFISPEHIAIGLFTVDDGNADQVLKRLGANVNHLATAAVARLQGELAKDGREPPVSSKEMPSLSRNASGTRSPDKTKGESPLDQFCVDLTARASEGLIDPVIGRENENKRIMSLDIGLLMAGAKERGELEARVTALLSEAIKSGEVILFIDEVHTLIGSGTVGRGNKGAALDIANLLKPALGRGALQVYVPLMVIFVESLKCKNIMTIWKFKNYLFELKGRKHPCSIQ
ncbi:chaperone protein ClpD, chloroplastic-like [Gossypium australe]|uniref:Chaperone protein ClpD, chloroplastic-like n=1 Tax=Gossypium australe TaxID=47621 RepID=A0A5B6UKX5_9ROSI|nr:chaperone protein ClpD, chloroplastic-like [Gossypium australe]